MGLGLETSQTNLMRLPALPLARYRLRFKQSGSTGLPDYAGSAWRGALGHALRKLVCVTRLDGIKTVRARAKSPPRALPESQT